ncbi:M24 family metallopeptidase [Priestia aryabhattai]|uniref:M24 family metallopeptidase n=1 Tax=Priestia aryabhattai TaxID=412384 RepID=UPI001C0C79E3|nr:Xaa-Pro peptidase family protein [Priestia aryabhattai]MBU3568642.1 M24 family metallopeptidase [Priestia aryabhattai]
MSFGTKEYRERIKKTKEKMALQGIEVLLISDPANIYYLSGYDSWSFYAIQVLIIISDEDEPIWIGHEQEIGKVNATSWLYYENVISYSNEYIASNVKHPMNFISEILDQIGQSKRTIGAELYNYYFTFKCYQLLKKGLPTATFKDASFLVSTIRIIKSNTEIEYMRHAAIIGEKAMVRGINSININTRSFDILDNVVQTQVNGAKDLEGNYSFISPALSSSRKAHRQHLTSITDEYLQGDTIILEVSGSYKRYYSSITRTINLGKPSERMQLLSDISSEGLNKCIEMIKPGVNYQEVEETWRKTIKKNGFCNEINFGSSIGLNYPPNFGKSIPSIGKQDNIIIEPNMTFHFTPCIWLGNERFETSESVLVTDTRCEPFISLEKNLFIKEEQVFIN